MFILLNTRRFPFKKEVLSESVCIAGTMQCKQSSKENPVKVMSKHFNRPQYVIRLKFIFGFKIIFAF